jgi:hypothetical protein
MRPGERSVVRAVIATSLAGVALSLGCGDLIDADMPASSQSCSTNADCPKLETCYELLCRDICVTDLDCQDGESCQSLPSTRACLPPGEADSGAASEVAAETGVEDGAAPAVADGPTETGDGAPSPLSLVVDAADEGTIESGPTPACQCGSCGTPSKLELFGGNGDLSGLNDTWEWNGATWTQAHPVHSPSSRWAASFAPLRGCGILFGGTAGFSGPYMNDQWMWDGTDWTEVSGETDAGSVPLPRSGALMAALNGQAFLFGGRVHDPTIRFSTLDDTWAWDGSAWTSLGPTTPPERLADMAFATFGGGIVMFGGDDEDGEPTSDMEIWDGNQWTAVTASGPSPRAGASMAALGDKLVMFGGTDDDGPLDETWTWDGQVWTQEHPAKSPNARFYASAGALNGVVVLFGGEDSNQNYSDTWTWDGTTWAYLEATGPEARSNAAMIAR